MVRSLDTSTRDAYERYCLTLAPEQLAEALGELLQRKTGHLLSLAPPLRRRIVLAIRACPAWLLARAIAANTDELDGSDPFWDRQCD